MVTLRCFDCSLETNSSSNIRSSTWRMCFPLFPSREISCVRGSLENGKKWSLEQIAPDSIRISQGTLLPIFTSIFPASPCFHSTNKDWEGRIFQLTVTSFLLVAPWLTAELTKITPRQISNTAALFIRPFGSSAILVGSVALRPSLARDLPLSGPKSPLFL